MKTKLITGLAVVLFLALGSTAHAGEWKSGNIAGFKKAWLYIPSTTAPRPAGANKRSLVVHLIGCGQVIDQAKLASGWEQAAEAYGMYVLIPSPNAPAFPNKQGPKVECFNYGYDTSGNYGAAVPTPNSPDHKALIAAPGLLRQQYSDIDPDQVYVAGLSAGAAMAQQVACMAPDVYRGVGNAAGPGLNSRQAQAVAPLNGAGMVMAQPTQAAMQQQCTSWMGGKTADFRSQVWSIVSDNNFLPVGNMTSVGGVYTFDIYNDGSVWDGDKFTPTEYHNRTFGMLKSILLDNNYTEESLTLLESTEETRGTGCGDQAANITFTGATPGTQSDAAPVRCNPLDVKRRHWKAEAVHLRTSEGHIQLSRIEQDTLKHSWPNGVENTANWMACVGHHQGYEITMEQISSPDHPNYGVLKDPATGLWRPDPVGQLDNGAIGCIYFNSFSVNYPMYLAELWNNNNPRLGAPLGNNKKPNLVADVTTSGYAITVSGTATDEDGTVTSLVISLTNTTTGDTYGPINASMNGTGYFTHTFTGLSDGRHQVTVVATDDEGETAEFTQGAAVGNVPNNKPVINTFTATSEEKGCIAFKGTATDSDGSVTAVTISIIGRDSVNATVSGDNFSAKVCDLPLGRTYSGTAVATDDLGAKSDEKPYSVQVPLSTDCESVTGFIADDLEHRTDLIEPYTCYGVLTCYRTTGDQETVTKAGGPEYTIYIGGDGKGYLVDPKNCAPPPVTFYTITAIVSGSGGKVTPPAQQVAESETAAILVTADSGKKIDSVSGCGGTLSGNTFTTAPATADCTVTAKFVDEQVVPNNYTVMLSAGANGSISPSGAQTVEEGKTLSFTVSPAAGYEVNSVQGCGAYHVSGNSYSTTAVTQNCSVSATFKAEIPVPNEYTITLSAGANGSISPSGAQTVQEGKAISFVVSPAPGFVVDKVTGCGASNVSGNSYTTAAATQNCSVLATFKADIPVPVYYTVTLSAAANGSVSPSGDQAVLAGNTLSFTTKPKAGYAVKSVSGCGAYKVGDNQYQTVAVTADCQVNVTFESDAVPSHNVTLTAEANGTISPSGVQQVFDGAKLSFAVNPASGYKVKSVEGCGAVSTGGNGYATQIITQDCTVVATFEPGEAKVNVTFAAGPNGSISPSGVRSYNQGTMADFVVNPASGYQVLSVVGSGCAVTQVSGSNWRTAALTSDCTVNATFKAVTNYHDVTLIAGANGEVSPSGLQKVAEGDTLSFTLIPSSGYVVDSVDGCGATRVSANQYTTSSITQSCSVTATFAPAVKTIDVTLVAGANGSISPEGVMPVMEGERLNFSVTADNGYRIDAVEGCGATQTSGSGYRTATISEACTVTATFVAKTVAPVYHSVTLSAGANGSISPAGTEQVLAGNAISFNVAAEDGYRILNVEGCGALPSGSAGSYITAAINGDCDVVATFEQITYVVTAKAGTGGTIAPKHVASVVPGTVLSFDVEADGGYVIKVVSGCGDTYTAPSDTTSVTYQTAPIGGSCSVSATFAKKINIPIPSGSGSISPAMLLLLIPTLPLLRQRRRRRAA